MSFLPNRKCLGANFRAVIHHRCVDSGFLLAVLWILPENIRLVFTDLRMVEITFDGYINTDRFWQIPGAKDVAWEFITLFQNLTRSMPAGRFMSEIHLLRCSAQDKFLSGLRYVYADSGGRQLLHWMAPTHGCVAEASVET